MANAFGEAFGDSFLFARTRIGGLLDDDDATAFGLRFGDGLADGAILKADRVKD